MSAASTNDLGDIDFRLVFEATPHPYLLLAPDAPRFTILGVNEAYAKATGVARGAILGRGLFEAFPDNPGDSRATGVSDLRSSLERVLRERAPDVMGVQKYDIQAPGAPGQFEVRYWSPVNAPVLGADGQIRYLIHRVEDVTAFVLARESSRLAAMEPFSGAADRTEAEVLRAETELKAANRQLKAVTGRLAEANAHLKALDSAKTRFFSNVSHEFRTPLTLLLGPLDELLDDRSSALTDDQRALLAITRRNGRRLLRLVNALLEVTKLEAGQQTAAFAPRDLSALTADIASGFRSVCERAGLTLRVTCPPLPQPVYLDAEMWEKVVLNLISNAFKFTHDGGIEVAARPSDDGLSALVTVRDTGVGVPPDDLPRLFDRFYRVENARGRTIEGSGIGLSLTQELVRLHGGQIFAESAPGAGSVFTVMLPFGRAHLPDDQVRAVPGPTALSGAGFSEDALSWMREEPAAEVNPLAAPFANENRGRVVVADDNADMRAYIGRLLRAAGHEVVAEVANGAAALAAIRRETPDLVLSDVMMPVLDGLGLMRTLRDDPAVGGVAVILLSANADEAARAEGLAAGADDYLAKPFSVRELVARVEGAIRLVRLRRTLEEQLHQSQKMDAVGQLTGGIAHDFNNLLTAVIGGLDLIARKPMDERTPRVAENALAAARRGAKLTGQLLAFSRGQRLDVRPVDLQGLLGGMGELMARSIGPSIKVKTSVDPEARMAMADASQLELAILNLAVNARDAMPDGGELTITATRERLTGGDVPPGDYVVLLVADTGAGMSPEVAARAFEPFFSTKGVGKGSGLGLSQVYGMARKGGGIARIAAADGRGAAIQIILPAADQALAAKRSDFIVAPVGKIPSAADRSAKILVIDDDQEVRELFVEGLRGHGYRVSEASDGYLGLRMLETESPDAMLVDFAMPGMNGAEVARRARLRRPSLPILFATGFSDSDVLAQIPNAVVLRKPLSVSDLAQAIDGALQ